MTGPVVTQTRLSSDARIDLIALELYGALEKARKENPEMTVEETCVALAGMLDRETRELRLRTLGPRRGGF